MEQGMEGVKSWAGRQSWGQSSFPHSPLRTICRQTCQLHEGESSLKAVCNEKQKLYGVVLDFFLGLREAPAQEKHGSNGLFCLDISIFRSLGV